MAKARPRVSCRAKASLVASWQWVQPAILLKEEGKLELEELGRELIGQVLLISVAGVTAANVAIDATLMTTEF